MKLSTVGFTLLFLLTLAPFDARTADEETARNNFASELVECAAYYDICAEGIRRTANLEGAVKAETAAKRALDIARTYTRNDVVLARYKLAMEHQIKTIDGNYANLSLLTVKYKDICKQALETPEVRLNYWKKK